jgi:hypothetical protein
MNTRAAYVATNEVYGSISKSFRTEWTKKCTLTFGITRRVMASELTRLTHKIAIQQLHLVAETYTICRSRSRRLSPEFWIHPCTLPYS